MGYIKKLKNNELVGGTDKTTIYPVTSTEAVFEEVIEDDESNFKSQKFLNNNITGDRINQETITNYNIAKGTLSEDRLDTALKTKVQEGYDTSWKFKGEYDKWATYDAHDVVYDSATNSSYISLQADNQWHPVNPDDEAYVEGWWQVIMDGKVSTDANNALVEYIENDLTQHVTDAISDANGAIQDMRSDTLEAYTEAEQLAQQITDWSSSEISSTPSYRDQHPLSNRASSAQVGYFECGTSSTTQASNQIKAVTAEGYALPTSGGAVKIKMYAANTYTPTTNNPVKLQFNADATTLKELRYNDEAVSPSNTWDAGEVISVYYDGSVYQAGNAQGGSNKKIDAYLYGDLRTLAVGQTYKMNESVKTTDKQLLKMSKDVGGMNLTDEVTIDDLKTASAATYKALKSVVAYNGTETEGLYAIGKPSVVTITIDASGLDIEEDTDISVTIGNVTNTITVPSAPSETKAADIAALIEDAFSSIPGWSLTDNEDGTLTLRCNSGGNNTITVTSNVGETGLVITSNAVSGNSVLNQYNNGSWEAVSINTWVADTEMWDSLTENELRAYARQDTLSNTLNYDNVRDNKVAYYTLADVSWTTGKNINANSSSASFGNLGTVSWERASGKINCINATVIEVRVFTDNQSSRGLVFYDINDTPLVGHVFKTQSSVVYSNATYEVPNNAAYFRTTFTNDNNTFFARVIRNNPLGIYSEKSANSDAAISDADGNQVVKFVGGHVITKNFNSANINDSVGFLNDRYGKNIYKRNQLYALDFSDISPIILGTWNVSNDGYISNGSTFGSNNVLTINKFFAMTGNYMICDFTIAEGGKAYIGCGNTLCSVDFPNSLFSVYTEGSSSTVSASEDISLDGYPDIKLRVILKCHVNWMVEAQLVNLKSGETIAVINSGTGRGRLKGNPKFYSTSAEMRIYDIRVATNLGENNNCWLYATGDSITEGYRMTESDNYVHRYAALFAEGLVKCSGNSGCKIDNVIARLKTEASIIKPVYTMVMIGTNGGNTDVNLTELINIILSYGSIPIINHIPANSNATVPTSVNNTIDVVVRKFREAGVHILSCKMHMAVATDNDESKTEASALTIDGIHLNAQGHLAMFNRMKVDAPELFNF